MYAVDPRGAPTRPKWADVWLGIDVGSDIALANAVAREIIDRRPHEHRVHQPMPRRASTNVRRVPSSRYTLARAAEVTGVPAEAIRALAHDYATGSETAQLCWTLGITEHHNATDNVLALINLALLTGHVGRYGIRTGTDPWAEQRPGRWRHGGTARTSSRGSTTSPIDEA